MADTVARAVWIMLVLMMVASALMARRMPMARMMLWGALWATLFFGVYYLFTLIEPKFAAWQQSRRGGDVNAVAPALHDERETMILVPQPNPTGAGVTVPMRSDGHYWVDASINGQILLFLIDSGASITALSSRSAGQLAPTPERSNPNILMQTANGRVLAKRATISSMNVGSIHVANLPVVVLDSFGDLNVLGMNFLNTLRSWRVEDGQMILEPR